MKSVNDSKSCITNNITDKIYCEWYLVEILCCSLHLHPFLQSVRQKQNLDVNNGTYNNKNMIRANIHDYLLMMMMLKVGRALYFFV